MSGILSSFLKHGFKQTEPLDSPRPGVRYACTALLEREPRESGDVLIAILAKGIPVDLASWREVQTLV